MLWDFEIEGDIGAIFELADYLITHQWSRAEKVRLMSMAPGISAKLPHSNRGQVHLLLKIQMAAAIPQSLTSNRP